MKTRVYLETTIVSYLVGWLNQHDLYVAAQQEFTRAWWTTRRQEYDLFASAVVVKEARAGKPELAAARLAFLNDVSLLEVTEAADDLKSACYATRHCRRRQSWTRFISPLRRFMGWTIC